jgi:hypothetical protein
MSEASPSLVIRATVQRGGHSSEVAADYCTARRRSQALLVRGKGLEKPAAAAIMSAHTAYTGHKTGARQSMANVEPFGQVAIKMGFCNQDDIDKALDVQKALNTEQKAHKLIGMILLESGALSTDQLIRILKYYDHSARVPELEPEG